MTFWEECYVEFPRLTCIHFIKRRVLCNSLYPLVPLCICMIRYDMFLFRFDHEVDIRKKIEEKLIAGREVRLVDRHGILMV